MVTETQNTIVPRPKRTSGAAKTSLISGSDAKAKEQPTQQGKQKHKIHHCHLIDRSSMARSISP
jgi:hypothetical protein